MKKRAYRHRFALALALALVAVALVVGHVVAVAVVNKGIIELVSPAFSRGPQVLLGEIASINVDDAELRRSLETLEVGPTPLPGSTRKFNLGQIQVRMRQQKLDPAQFSYGGLGEVVVHSVSQTVGAAEIERAAVAELVSSTGFSLAAHQVAVARVDFPQGVQAPSGKVTLVPRMQWPGADMNFVRVNVDVLVDGVLVRTAPVWLRITAPLAIERGAAVTILIQVGAVEVRAQGSALEDGRAGQLIRVRNSASGAEITAAVCDSSTVRAVFSTEGVSR